MQQRRSLHEIHGPLFGDEPHRDIRRRTDPATSNAAAAEHTASGDRASNRALILRRIWSLPDSTCQELAQGWTLTAYEISKRISELNRKGLIESEGSRKCTVSGRPARYWRVA